MTVKAEAPRSSLLTVMAVRPAGTLLLREYQGERHTVTVVPNGYLWREMTYASLSTIARVITGTNWNGPRFFRLRSGAEPTASSEMANVSSAAPDGQPLVRAARLRCAGRRPGTGCQGGVNRS